MRVIASPRFLKAKKKAVKTLQLRLDQAVLQVVANPDCGQAKKGDLAGISVYKFKAGPQQYLVAYSVELEELFLLAWGVHENFYRNLKK